MRSSDRGAAAVEFALLLPVVLLIIFGIVDFGRMLNAQITLTEAAREGARAAALVTPDGRAAGEARARQVARSIGAVAPSVTDCSTADTTSAVADVAYTFSFVTPLGFMVGDEDGATTLTGHGVMPCLH